MTKKRKVKNSSAKRQPRLATKRGSSECESLVKNTEPKKGVPKKRQAAAKDAEALAKTGEILDKCKTPQDIPDADIRTLVEENHIVAAATIPPEVDASIGLFGLENNATIQKGIKWLREHTKNATVYVSRGAANADLLLCACIDPVDPSKFWCGKEFIGAEDEPPFKTYVHFCVQRFGKYKGRDVSDEGRRPNETVDPICFAAAENKTACIDSFLCATGSEQQQRVWIPNSGLDGVSTFFAFIDSQKYNHRTKEEWLALLRLELGTLFDSISDCWAVEKVPDSDGQEGGPWPIYSNWASKTNFILRIQLTSQSATGHRAETVHEQFIRVSDTITELQEKSSDLAKSSKVICVNAVFESHEQSSFAEFIKSYLRDFGQTVNFAHVGYQNTEYGNHGFSLPMPLGNTVVVGTSRTGKSKLVSHVAAAFLRVAEEVDGSTGTIGFDVLYVNCKGKKVGTYENYEEKPEDKDCYIFAAHIHHLTKVRTLYARDHELKHAFNIAAKDEPLCVYTDLRELNDGEEEWEEFVPKRDGRGLLIVIDELLGTAARYPVVSKQVLNYLKSIKGQRLSQGFRYILVGQELSQFSVEDGDGTISEDIRKSGQDLLGTSTVLVGPQDDTIDDNQHVYKRTILDKITGEKPDVAWEYESISTINTAANDLPGKENHWGTIGPFLMSPSKESIRKIPIPGSIPRLPKSEAVKPDESELPKWGDYFPGEE